MIVAIDGPAASGKSTTARAVADALGYLYLDTGAMYRAVAVAFARADAPADAEQAGRLLPDMQIDLRRDDGMLRVLLDGEDVTEEIRAEQIGALASRVAAVGAVREKLVAEQRRVARRYEEEGGGVVIDGRDIGTVVFPNAEVKIFMKADPDVRATRRLEEIRRKGGDARYEDVLQEMRARDRQDEERSLAPLKKAGDAIELDTSRRSFEEQVALVIEKVKERASRSAV